MTQLKEFCLVLLFGVAGGLVYEFFRLPKHARERAWLRIALDILFCLVFAAGYVFFALNAGFSGFRLYHAAALILGLFLYEKTFHKTVAFFAQRVYNAAYKEIIRKKERKAWQTRDRSLPKKQRGSP